MEFVKSLVEEGWAAEQGFPVSGKKGAVSSPGKFDVLLSLEEQGLPPFVVEWETGNISSSHRAVNKMALGLLQGHLVGGLLVLPTRALYRYLTDRIGNFEELEPYFPMWKALPIEQGYLGIMAVEHDEISHKVLRIGKATDGRAAR